MTRPFPCCQCDYDCHCPDYEDDWTFIFCSTTFTFGTWVSGTKIEDYLNGLGAFNIALVHTVDVSSNVREHYYLATLTLPSGGTHYTSFFQDYHFKTLEVTFIVTDTCTSRSIGISCDIYAKGDLNSVPNTINLLILNQLGGSPSSTCSGVLAGTIDASDYIDGGFFKGTAGVVSLTC